MPTMPAADAFQGGQSKPIIWGQSPTTFSHSLPQSPFFALASLCLPFTSSLCREVAPKSSCMGSRFGERYERKSIFFGNFELTKCVHWLPYGFFLWEPKCSPEPRGAMSTLFEGAYRYNGGSRYVGYVWQRLGAKHEGGAVTPRSLYLRT